jgi:capsular polysaccharide transport system ATP-binding protein
MTFQFRTDQPTPRRNLAPIVQINAVSKSFHGQGREIVVADNISLAIPAGTSVALLGVNGAGKSTLLSMISGCLRPDEGRILRNGTVSWPVGFAGSFHGDLTGAQNTRFVARTYGVDTDELLDFVTDFADLGDQMNDPVRGYSSGMRARLAFALSMGLPFDLYLVDEVTAVGDAKFRAKSAIAFKSRMENAGAIMVSHNMDQLRNLCSAGMVLRDGKLIWFDNVNDAIWAYQC